MYNKCVEITLATKDDLEGILPLQTQIYRIKNLPENAPQVLEELIDANYCDVFVAKDDNKIVGSGLIFYLKNPAHERPFAFLEGVVVDNDYRGQGIGTALSKFAIELARNKNCYKIIFTSGNNRADIHKFYENLGFIKWGHEFRMDLD